jgi:prophage tail gpP-like protein
MPRPIPGTPYVVVSGDNLSRIAATAYGDPKKWKIIWKANKGKIRSDNPNLIFPGEILVIPGDPTVKELTGLLSLPDLPGKEKDDFTLIIDGLEIPVLSATITRTIDTAVDGWSAVIPWEPGKNSKLDKIIHPYTYARASAYLGEKLMVDGYFYDLTISMRDSGDTAELTGYGFTADLVDCSVTPPYEQKKVTLFDRAKSLLEPYTIDVIYDSEDTEIFKKVTASPQDTVFSHLASLASQRGILISSTRKGELLFTTAKTGKSVGTLKEGSVYFQNPTITWSGRSRFFAYRIIRQSRKKKTRIASATDEAVKLSRLKVFSANDTTGGNLQQAANWRRSKQLADALEIGFPVAGWYAPDGNLWEENTIVTLSSETLLMPDGFDFIIKRVEYSYDNNGTKATLSLVPPQAYTGEEIEEPWLI